MRSILIFALFTVLVASALHAEDADEVRDRGISALKESQTNPRAIVDAARLFVKAGELYNTAGNEEKVVEMNSYLYWCKKKMTLDDIEAFTKGGEVAVTGKLAALEKIIPKTDDAQKWFDRADQFAKKYPNEHLLIAVRFYEVADRFKGSDASLKAQDRSLKEQLLDKPSTVRTVAQPSSAPRAPVPVGDAGKRNVPLADDIKTSERFIKDLLKEDYAKTDAPGRVVLVGKLLQQADENKTEAAAEYVLLHEARDIAVLAGDAGKASEAQKRLLDGFKIDRAAALLDLRKLETVAKSAESVLALATLYSQGAESALSAADYDQAVRFNSRAEDLIPLLKDAAMKAHLKTEIPRVQAIKKESVAALAAQKTLQTKSDDAEASLVAGKFALLLGDAERAMTLLAKSKDALLSGLAKRELAPPTDAGEQALLADAWFDRAEKEPLVYLKTKMQERAALWYASALPNMTGLAKLKVEGRLKTLPHVEVAAAEPAHATAAATKAVASAAVGDLNNLSNWNTKHGNWTQDETGILGEGDSEAEFKTTLPMEFILEFTMTVKKGMRPRIHFNSEIKFGNEGYDKNLFAYGGKTTGTKFKYEHDQALKIRAVCEKEKCEFFVNDTSVCTSVRGKPDKVTLRISGGDNWSKGAVLYSNFKLLPMGAGEKVSAPAAAEPAGKEMTQGEVATLAANTTNAYTIGALKRGETVTLQYVEGRWKEHGKKATDNPDAPNTNPGSALVIAEKGVGDAPGNVIVVVPTGTAAEPFVYRADRDIADAVLRIQGQGQNFGGYPGSVRYRVFVSRGGSTAGPGVGAATAVADIIMNDRKGLAFDFKAYGINRDSKAFQPGLLLVEYPIQATQEKPPNYFNPQKFDSPERIAGISNSSSIKFDEQKNAIAAGYLKIDADGEYQFNGNSFYDRNSFYIDGKELCKYRDGEGKIVSIKLARGLIPIAICGYVHGRGTAVVKWIPPGKTELELIPENLLFHNAPTDFPGTETKAPANTPSPTGAMPPTGLFANPAEVNIDAGGDELIFITFNEGEKRGTHDGNAAWSATPEWLKGRTYSFRPNVKDGDKRATLEFTVAKDGMVVMACTPRWGGGGNRSGGWFEKCKKKDDLIAEGWKEAGTIPTSDGQAFVVFTRMFKKGESYSIRTEKYWAPILIK